MKELARTISVFCPYCGKLNTIKHDSVYSDLLIATCDYFEGGCDRKFVVEVNVHLSVRQRKSKVKKKKKVRNKKWQFKTLCKSPSPDLV